MSLFWRLVERGPIRFIKGKRRLYVTTEDLNSNGKLKPDYLQERKERKKKKTEGASPSIHDIWRI